MPDCPGALQSVERKMRLGPGYISAFSMYKNIFDEDTTVVARCNPFGDNPRPCKLEFHDLTKFTAESKYTTVAIRSDIYLSVPPGKSGKKKDPKEKKTSKSIQKSSKGKMRNKKGGKNTPRPYTMVSAMRVPTGIGNIESDASVESYLPTSYFQVAFIGTVCAAVNSGFEMALLAG